MLSECDQPMNLTRYHNLPHLNLESRTSSTSYSSWSLMMMGPGCGGCRCSAMSSGVSGITESWGLKLLCYLLCLQGRDTEEKESRSSVTSSPNDKQIDPALWLWQSKQG